MAWKKNDIFKTIYVSAFRYASKSYSLRLDQFVKTT